MIWRKITPQVRRWSVTLLPGIAALGLIILLRLGGGLQVLECVMLDFFLSARPAEPIDQRVVIVGIDEGDIQHLNYPVSDREIAALLRTLQQYQPRAIGLDLVRDLPVEPGHGELVAAFKEIENLLVVEKVIPVAIAPPPQLTPSKNRFCRCPLG